MLYEAPMYKHVFEDIGSFDHGWRNLPSYFIYIITCQGSMVFTAARLFMGLYETSLQNTIYTYEHFLGVFTQYANAIDGWEIS